MLIAGATIANTLLSFLTPSLAIDQIELEIWAGQQRVTAERQRLNHAVTAELRSAQPGAISGSDRLRLRETARDIQDGILPDTISPDRP
jgi:hypothetical protein